MKEQKIEGYWKSTNPQYEHQKIQEKDYLIPIPNILTEQEAKEIYNLIVNKQATATLIRYKGFSGSRITGERLGSQEYETNEWRWPADFAEHYVLTHKVKPTDEFLNYIGYNDKF